MTTSDANAATLGTGDPTGLTARAASFGPAESLNQVDDVAVDRIAANLLAALPGVALPEYRLPAPSASTTAIPSAVAAAPRQAGVPNVPTPAAVLPEATSAAATEAGTPTPGAALSALPGFAAPGAAIPGIPSVAIPPLIDLPAPEPSEVPHPSRTPRLTLVTLNADTLATPLPHLFDLPSKPAVAEAYYFLTKPSGHQTSTPLLSHRVFDVRDIRRDFPILQERVHGRPLVWLDNAATTQKPQAVIDRLAHYYSHENSNVHRAAHTLAARSTDAYEGARQKVQRFLGAGSPDEIVFVRGTTEAINLVANSWGRKNLSQGDEIVLTTIEHHSNIVPWQLLAQAVGAVLRVVPVNDRGEVLLSDYGKLLNGRTKLVAITHVSNALGTIVPVGEMIQAAHRHGARVLVDGAQAVSHFPVNVQALDADFYVLSGHKLFAPTGVGVLYGKKALLDEMPPWQGGGNMIQNVTFEESTFADPPARFEAGTATLGPAVGLGAAVDYLEKIGMENIARYEHELLIHATDALGRIPGVRLIGTAAEKASVVSFIADGISAEEMGGILDQEGIAVRAGHHCAQPTMARFGVTSTVRPSLAFYNTHGEIELLARTLRRALRA
ncbi:MAG TPA: SufS family cysteine desulfurase [Candidatus Acidoferrales bacterium]|nr:SufS family cysteine desulfurase [Candidatus Acidoferrales bacterium]